MADHIGSRNHEWKTFLFHAQSHEADITYESLLQQGRGNWSAWQLSQMLYSFLLKFLGPKLYAKRRTLCGGLEGNGFQLWKQLFTDYEGGDQIVQNAARDELMHFQPIPDAQLVDGLDKFLELFDKYGQGLPHEFIVTHLKSIFPSKFKEKPLDRPEVNTPWTV